MLNKLSNFESNFGVPFPSELKDFYSRYSARPTLFPMGFRFNNLLFIIEIEYLLDTYDEKNHDIENNLCSFAITPDGFELLVHLNTTGLEIFQKEYDDIDEIGITMKDLLDAESYSLLAQK